MHPWHASAHAPAPGDTPITCLHVRNSLKLGNENSQKIGRNYLKINRNSPTHVQIDPKRLIFKKFLPENSRKWLKFIENM
jgi:hypothetical protein